ncbi:MAG: secondary thiamine-phosphate synthase enzyme YjbQ [Kiritimatiellae bacterium]|jgi:secondary thiamine-phosphate synthase enzyme|nr:secondary thiamine-phosphate synthase enzyme YjbQ [Kiritimatiellia bacterium]
MKTLSVKTSSHDQMIDITRDIRTAVAELGIEDGTVTIYTPHTTCGLTINENADPDVVHDFLKQLELMVPWRQPFYKHMEGNSAAHVKASMMGFALTVIVEEGILQLGTWQGIYLCEFDGPRTRSVFVK